MNKKVSIIVPNYNHGKYLKARLDSVLNQTFHNFEVIILDDCSTDNSQEIINAYKGHSKIKHIIFNDINGGNTFKQWKKGFELCQGEYIWIAESDDLSEATFLDEVVTPILDKPNILVSYCQSLVFNEEDVIIWFTKESHLSQIKDGNRYVCEKMMGGNSIPNASAAVFKRSALEHITSDYDKFEFCGDWFFWVLLCSKGDVRVSGKLLNYYRRHSNTVSSKSRKLGLQFTEGLQILHYILNNFSPKKEDLKHAVHCIAKHYIDSEKDIETKSKKKILTSFKNEKLNIISKINLLRIKQNILRVINKIKQTT